MSSAEQKLVSNLAKYKNGQLTCIVCNVPVKNEIYWTGHVNGRLHRDNINLLRGKSSEPEPKVKPSKSSNSTSIAAHHHHQSSQSIKRSRDPFDPDTESEPSNKKISISKNTQEEQDKHIFKIPKDPGPASPSSTSASFKNQNAYSDSKSNSKVGGGGINMRANRLQIESYEREFESENGNDMDVDIDDYKRITEKSSASRPSVDEEDSSGSDTQNSKINNGASSSKTNKQNPGGKSKLEPKTDLPEGFFDDPKADAKARGIDFVDPEEAEWDKFMKEIASEELESDNILVVDEEESRKERELDEIEDMMGHWQRVIDLEKKKETRAKPMDSNKTESDSSGDEDDFNEELDWRVKKF